MGRLFVISLEGMAYNCKHCHTHLAVSDDIISKQSAGGVFWFRSSDDQVSIHDENRHLIKAVGEEEERMMMTGMHTVVDIFCAGCGSTVGWKYESAYDKAQKYKDGKFILERFKVLGPDGSNYMAVQEAQAAESDGDDV